MIRGATICRRAADGDAYEWLAPGARTVRTGDAVALAADCGEAGAVLLLDAVRVRLTAADVPARSETQLVRALPFALEEALAEEPEDVHVAIGPRSSASPRPVAVVNRRWLEHELDALTAAGIERVSASSEALAVPVADDACAVVLDGSRAVFRGGACLGGALYLPDGRVDDLDTLLAAFAPDGKAGTLFVRTADAKAPAGWRTVVMGETGLLGLARDGLDAALCIVVAERGRKTRAGVLRSAAPGLAAALLLGLLVGVAGTKAWRAVELERAAGQLEASARARFESLFPDVRRIVDMRAQARQALAAAGQDAPAGLDFMRALEVLGDSFAAADTGLVLTGLDFNRGALTVSVDARSIETVESWRGALDGAVGEASLLSAETRDGRVAARVRLAER